ncbi:response regulator transcription factor [Sphingobium sp. OAS761]|uniref:response regulator transcription factor n=1 Tax=Sphingobium sp. OAS761 TaxID=2817901 RepID=UPI0020A076E6|nr:response regulator [Sphingobium sp. OAS761]
MKRAPLHRRETAGTDRPGQPLRRLRLLLIDENPTARTVAARRLSHLDHDVMLAENGHVALGQLLTRPADIILIDMGLVLLPAIATMKKIRSAKLAGKACFVMLTGRLDAQSAVEALDAGADDHVTKPFDFDVLDARLRHLHQRAEQMDMLARNNAELDARIARRAVELGETREALRELQADRARLVSSIQALHDELERLAAQ